MVTVGERVQHKSGVRMTVKAIRGSVATCIMDTPTICMMQNKPYKQWIAICAVENLTPITPKQLTISF